MSFDKLVLLIPGLGMMVVAVIALGVCHQKLRPQSRWFWIGAGLWTIAVVLKLAAALLTNQAVFGFLHRMLPHPVYVACGGLYVGIQSSVFEMGFTILAGLIWSQLGKDFARAIAIGVGAGAFEAFLLGLLAVVGVAVILMGTPGTEGAATAIRAQQDVTPVFWLVAPVERITAVLVHASSRALILLGLTYRKLMMVFWGFWIFALLDSVAGAAQLSGRLGTFSLWWIELAILPFGLIGIPILWFCARRFPAKASEPEEITAGSGKPADLSDDIFA